MRELAAAKESVALERGLLNGVFAEGAFHGREYLAFTEVRATRVAALARFRQVATAPQRAALHNAFATEGRQNAPPPTRARRKTPPTAPRCAPTPAPGGTR